MNRNILNYESEYPIFFAKSNVKLSGALDMLSVNLRLSERVRLNAKLDNL